MILDDQIGTALFSKRRVISFGELILNEPLLGEVKAGLVVHNQGDFSLVIKYHKVRFHVTAITLLENRAEI